MSEDQLFEPGRRVPSKGVQIMPGRPNWVFLTVCTEKRSLWLAQPTVQRTLHHIWKDQATAWLVGEYVIMPDHLHLFCAPGDLRFTSERWAAFWKDRFAKARPGYGRFQAGAFHHRLRDEENYAQKWRYARENPVRKGLVQRPEDWPFWGRVHDVGW
jgi:putative transposase